MEKEPETLESTLDKMLPSEKQEHEKFLRQELNKKKTWNEKNSTIYEYIRNNEKQKIGMFYATILPKHSGFENSEDMIGIGYSLCTPTARDEFKEKLMFNIAKGRANAGVSPHFPPSIENKARKFVDRCERYFRGIECRVPVYFE